MSVNPLDRPGVPFEIAMMNPNPTSSKTKDGPRYRISVEVEEEMWNHFMHANTVGMILAGLLFVSVDGGAQPEVLRPAASGNDSHPPENGKFWYRLFKNGFFNAPKVLEAIGPDREFLDWVARQPSCIDGQFTGVSENGEGYCDPAHVRRLKGGSGVALKPPYSAVPLTHDQHMMQHQHGESGTLEYHLAGTWSATEAQAWFENKANKYRYDWASKTLAKQLGAVESRAEVSPTKVRAWVVEKDLGHLLPEKCR